MLTSYTHLGTSSHIKQKKNEEHRQYIEFAGEKVRERETSKVRTKYRTIDSRRVNKHPSFRMLHPLVREKTEKKHLLVIRLEVCVLIHHR